MDDKELESLVEHIAAEQWADRQLVAECLARWRNKNTPQSRLTFEVVALYDKGFGPECMNLHNIEVDVASEAQNKAERMATELFDMRFGGKVEWQEVKIRPVR